MISAPERLLIALGRQANVSREVRRRLDVYFPGMFLGKKDVSSHHPEMFPYMHILNLNPNTFIQRIQIMQKCELFIDRCLPAESTQKGDKSITLLTE